MSTDRPSLKSHLLSSLSTHPGTHTYHLHVLQTAPRKSNGLYPFATPRPPRVYVQDVLIFLSEKRGDLVGKIKGKEDGETPRILIIALEATLYIVPQTATLLIYISKLDTSGHHSPSSTPPTSLLLRSFLTYFILPSLRPTHLLPPTIQHVWIQLFARAPPLLEKQYLFAGSGEWEGKMKRWRGDRGLCTWWRGVLGRLGEDVGVREGKEGEGGKVGMYYLLPGYNQYEAEECLRLASGSYPSSSSSSTSKAQWIYGHPYSITSPPLPCPYDPSDPSSISNLGRFIPYFEDCPKSRFLDEIGYAIEGDVRSPVRKRRRGESVKDAEGVKRERDEEKEKEGDKSLRPLGEMSRVSPDEFWERMSFRQECVSGAVTGFFTLVYSTPPSAPSSSPTSTPSPLQPQPGQIPTQLLKRVLTTLLTGVEFSDEEKAVRATEVVEGMIKSLCEGRTALSKAPPSSNPSVGAQALARTILNTPSTALGIERPKTPERDLSSSHFLTIPQTPKTPSKHTHVPEPSPNPFTEPVATLETYDESIYGYVEVRNPDRGAVERRGGKGGVAVGMGGVSKERGGRDAQALAQAQGGEASGGGKGHVPVTLLAVRKKNKKKL